MTIEDFVTHEINEYQTDNVREIIDYHDISIEYNDQLNKACDSSIFLFHQTAYITIKSDLNPLYGNFLLAHELGHYLMHYDENISFQFLLKTRKNSLEREANEFACRFLLHDIDLKEIENIDFIIKERGIPIKIWRSVCEYIII